MKAQGLSIIGIVLLLLALPAWGFLIIVIPDSPGFGGDPFRFFIAPISLCGATAAIWRLLRKLPNAWPLSAFIAGYGLIAALFIAAAIARAG